MGLVNGDVVDTQFFKRHETVFAFALTFGFQAFANTRFSIFQSFDCPAACVFIALNFTDCSHNLVEFFPHETTFSFI